MSVHTAVRIDYQPSQSLGVYPTRMTVSDASLGEFRDGLSQNIRLNDGLLTQERRPELSTCKVEL